MITVTGSALVDLMAYSDRLPVKGETVKGHQFQMTAGGKGANQAAASARLGGKTMFLGKMSGSDPLNQVLLEGFAWAGVDVSHVDFLDDIGCGVGVIHVGQDSQNQIIIVPGPNDLLTPDDVDSKLELLKGSSIVVTEFGIPLETAEHAVVRARELGVTTLVTPGPALVMSERFYRATDIITPNETEAKILTGIEVIDDNSALRASRVLHSRGVGSVIITMGEMGVFVSNGETNSFIHAVQVKAKDTTGAGDAFNGALAYCLDSGQDIFSAAHYATVAAGLSVTRAGTLKSMPGKKEVDDHIKKHNIDMGA
jgi:ribokinase